MRALVFDTTLGNWENTRGFELRDVPEPVLDEKKNPTDADKVLLKVHYAGICGTDRGIWSRAAFKDQILQSIKAEGKEYRILGHEFFGEVAKLGSKASSAAPYPLKVGDFAAPESHVVCNKCFQCLHGEKHVCTNEKILGISHDGGFAEFVKLPAHIVWKTGTSEIRPELGAMQEPFGNAVHAASKVPLKGKTIAVFGLGPIGLFLTLVARGLGASTIIGVEPNPVSQDMAKKLGIDYVIPLSPHDKNAPAHHRDEAVIKKIEELTGGLGVDVSFEMAGFNSSFNNALFATRRGGDVIAFGIKTGDFVLEDYNRFIVRGITVHAVIGRRLPETWETTQKLFADQKNKIQENIWNVILDKGQDTILPLKAYTKERFEEMMAKHPKILIEI
ncbi:MAG: Threonine 3-dehydrogenase [Parcubacteria group bacterium GW2011_GWA2_47_16]|nr:MAG: Threonine 3-dehydrogenase [Parcubacteria group bacterium GW2011_GWA2_47_16]